MPLKMGYFEDFKYLTIFPESYSLFPGRREHNKSTLSPQGEILEGTQQSEGFLKCSRAIQQPYFFHQCKGWGWGWWGKHVGNKC